VFVRCVVCGFGGAVVWRFFFFVGVHFGPLVALSNVSTFMSFFLLVCLTAWLRGRLASDGCLRYSTMYRFAVFSNRSCKNFHFGRLLCLLPTF